MDPAAFPGAAARAGRGSPARGGFRYPGTLADAGALPRLGAAEAALDMPAVGRFAGGRSCSTSPRLGGLLACPGEGQHPGSWTRRRRPGTSTTERSPTPSPCMRAGPRSPRRPRCRRSSGTGPHVDRPPLGDAARQRRASNDSLQSGARGGDRAAALALLPALGPGSAPAAASTQAPSAGFTQWLGSLDSMAEERLLHEARWRFCHYRGDASLHEFRAWLCEASRHADEASVQAMWRAQLRAWLLCVSRRRRGGDRGMGAAGPCEGIVLAEEVKHRIDSFVGGRLVWGVINAARAREVAESALRQIWRPESVMRAAALAAVASRFVHPAVVQAAEAGHMQCSTEIPTDDVALRALFEVTAAESRHEVGSLLSAHLALDGFEVEPKYHDPEYGLWRGFWVDKCNMVRLTLMW
ncbi:unnamed protein product [Prorocentrum cordatum]|uniref:Uncharacterized protein n=1 Tax=Prorocentrum cordatum TaxID=2364126 RepID=A0ABN9SRD2_9DINO|nr:unnamed protein product [Polarella glacialis]